MSRARRLIGGAVITVALLVGGGLGLIGCHVPADVVCQYFIRDGYRLYSAAWVRSLGAYSCTSYIPGTGAVDSYRVYEEPWRRIG